MLAMNSTAKDNEFSSISSLPQSKDRQYFAELIVEIERRIDVNAIQMEGLKLWPMIRWMLAREIKGNGH